MRSMYKTFNSVFEFSSVSTIQERFSIFTFLLYDVVKFHCLVVCFSFLFLFLVGLKIFSLFLQYFSFIQICFTVF